VWLSLSGEAVFDESRRFRGYRGVGTDVTERKRAQGVLRAAYEELARSNAELQQFAYVASHDLQEPLRMIGSYTQLLERRYGDRLDQDAREFMGFIVDGATRMKQLIEDLLAYSRVGTRGKEMRPVQAQAVLDKALVNLPRRARAKRGGGDARVPARGQRGRHAARATAAEPDRERDQVQEEGRGARASTSAWKTRGTNGISRSPTTASGSSRSTSSAIFLVFQRLHTQDEYRAPE